MEFEAWHIWLVVGIVMVIVELFTPIFLFASIAIGCVLASIASAFGADLFLQVLLLSIGTVVSFWFVRPLLKHLSKNQKELKTNTDAFIDRIGLVTETIQNELDEGQVKIDGVLWKAQASTNQIIEKGSKVKVTAIDSIVLTVDKIKTSSAEEPEPAGRENEPENNSTNIQVSQLKIKLGNSVQLIEVNDVRCIYSENKNSFAILENQKEVLLDDSLDKLEKTLPEKQFFRANRQYIIHRTTVSSYKSIENGKIELCYQPKETEEHKLIISRLKAATFRKWMQTEAEV